MGAQCATDCMLFLCGALPGRTYCLAAVHCVPSTTVRVDGLSMCEGFCDLYMLSECCIQRFVHFHLNVLWHLHTTTWLCLLLVGCDLVLVQCGLDVLMVFGQ